MMKKRRLLLFFLLLILVPKNVYAKAAETLGDLRQEYEDALQEKRDYENKSQAAKNEIERKQDAINKAEADLTKARGDYQQAEIDIADSNKKIDELKIEVEKVLLYLQQVKGQNAYVEYVSGASSMTDLVSRIEAVNQVTSYIQKTVKDLEEEIKRNEQLKIDLEKKQKQLESSIKEYEARIAKLQNDANSYDKFALNTDEKIRTTKLNYDTYKETCRNTIGKTDDSVKLSDCSNMPLNSGWLKPVTWGVTTDYVRKTGWDRHQAMDIGGMKEGSPVYAAASGVVYSIVERTSCGGNRVYIHSVVNGEQYTHFYLHLLDIKVKTGQIVSTDTVIGTVGGWSTAVKNGGYDKCTTGTHLHFGVARGFHGYGLSDSYVLAPPPGFPNRIGYWFNSRYDFYKG